MQVVYRNSASGSEAAGLAGVGQKLEQAEALEDLPGRLIVKRGFDSEYARHLMRFAIDANRAAEIRVCVEPPSHSAGWLVDAAPALYEFFTFYDQSLQGKTLDLSQLPVHIVNILPGCTVRIWGKLKSFLAAVPGRLYFSDPANAGYPPWCRLTIRKRRKPEEEEIWLSPEVSSRLQELCTRDHQLTLSTLIHAAWGLLLAALQR